MKKAYIIKYIVEGFQCMTSCPRKIHETTCAGSLFCKTDCEYCQYFDEINQIVVCSASKDTEIIGMEENG